MNNKVFFQLFEAAANNENHPNNMGARNNYLPYFKRVMSPPCDDKPTWEGYELFSLSFNNDLKGRDMFRHLIKYYFDAKMIVENCDLIRNGLQTGWVNETPEYLKHPLEQIEAIKYMPLEVRCLFFDLACMHDWGFAWKVFPNYFNSENFQKTGGVLIPKSFIRGEGLCTPEINPNNVINRVKHDIEKIKKKYKS